jgi:V8-like Glu-specific endopeptidase
MVKASVLNVVLCSCLLLLPGSRTRPRPLTEIVSEAQKGVAAVVVPATVSIAGAGMMIGSSIGTAFFVSDEYLLTAAHVIRAAPKEYLKLPIFGAPPDVNRSVGTEVVQFEVIEIDDEFDVALLHLLSRPLTTKKATSTHVRPFRVAIGSLSPGEAVAITGFGAGADEPLTVTGFTASQGFMQFDTAVRLMHYAETAPRFGEKSSIFVIDRPIAGGFSGSPVYLRDSGVVYGIAVAVKPDPNSGAPAMSLAHPLAKARELLDRHSIKYSSVTPLNPSVGP